MRFCELGGNKAFAATLQEIAQLPNFDPMPIFQVSALHYDYVKQWVGILDTLQHYMNREHVDVPSATFSIHAIGIVKDFAFTSELGDVKSVIKYHVRRRKSTGQQVIECTHSSQDSTHDRLLIWVGATMVALFSHIQRVVKHPLLDGKVTLCVLDEREKVEEGPGWKGCFDVSAYCMVNKEMLTLLMKFDLHLGISHFSIYTQDTKKRIVWDYSSAEDVPPSHEPPQMYHPKGEEGEVGTKGLIEVAQSIVRKYGITVMYDDPCP